MPESIKKKVSGAKAECRSKNVAFHQAITHEPFIHDVTFNLQPLGYFKGNQMMFEPGVFSTTARFYQRYIFIALRF